VDLSLPLIGKGDAAAAGERDRRVGNASSYNRGLFTSCTPRAWGGLQSLTLDYGRIHHTHAWPARLLSSPGQKETLTMVL